MKWDMNLAAQKKGDTTLNDTRKALSVYTFMGIQSHTFTL